MPNTHYLQLGRKIRFDKENFEVNFKFNRFEETSRGEKSKAAENITSYPITTDGIHRTEHYR